MLLIKYIIIIYQQIISIDDESLAFLSEERPQCQVAATHSFKYVWKPSPSHSSLILTLLAREVLLTEGNVFDYILIHLLHKYF